MKGKCFSEALFNATMDGRKTQFREVIKPQPDERGLRTTNVPFEDWHGREVKPRYKVGDTVYLKEPYALLPPSAILYKVYKYGYPNNLMECVSLWRSNTIPSIDNIEWLNPISMPEAAARHFIKITGVRAERVQDITKDDCFAEGISIGMCGNKSNWMKAYYCPGNNQPYITAKDAYEAEFNMINGKDSWEQNPWVWVYDYEILK